MGAFSVYKDIDQMPNFKVYTPDIQFNTFLYSSLIQTGANIIEIVDDYSNLLSHSKTIKERLVKAKNDDYIQISEKIGKIFSKYSDALHHKNKDLFRQLHITRVFIIDLLYSARNGSDFIFTDKLPNITPFKLIIQPDLYYPLENVLSAIKQ